MAASPTDVFCDRLQALVDIDSPSEGTEQEAVAALIGEWLAPIGCRQMWVDEPDNPARSLIVTLPGDGGPAVALLGHPGAGMIEIDPPGAPSRSVTLRAVNARASDPPDAFPPLRVSFAPGDDRAAGRV